MAESSAGRRTSWCFLGRVPYGEGLTLQERLRERLRRGAGPEWLLLLEHAPVYTLGRNATSADIRLDEEQLRRRGIEVHGTDRGGQVTYHGPGQLVGYPILDLRPDRQDVRRYVRDLEEVLVRTLADFGVRAEGRTSPFVGVWAGRRKVASIGVHLSRWLTTHGFALNVSTDLSSFGGIVPCGLSGVEMASIASLCGRSPELLEVAEICARHFSDVFERRMVAERPPEPIE